MAASLSELQTALNDLNSMSPGSGKVHEFNTHRIGLQTAIRLYGKPGHERVIDKTLADANKFMIELRRNHR